MGARQKSYAQRFNSMQKEEKKERRKKEKKKTLEKKNLNEAALTREKQDLPASLPDLSARLC